MERTRMSTFPSKSSNGPYDLDLWPIGLEMVCDTSSPLWGVSVPHMKKYLAMVRDTSSPYGVYLCHIWRNSIKLPRSYRADTTCGTDGHFTDGRTDRRTDGRTDGHGETSIPPTTSLCGGITFFFQKHSLSCNLYLERSEVCLVLLFLQASPVAENVFLEPNFSKP